MWAASVNTAWRQGGTYALAPGMNVFLAYLYGHQSEHGEDLLTGVVSTITPSSGTSTPTTTSSRRAFRLGTQFKW